MLYQENPHVIRHGCNMYRLAILHCLLEIMSKTVMFVRARPGQHLRETGLYRLLPCQIDVQ
jgi:hypothetical protein